MENEEIGRHTKTRKYVGRDEIERWRAQKGREHGKVENMVIHFGDKSLNHSYRSR